MQFTQEHDAIRRTMPQFIKNEINPFVDEWEREGIYPAHQVFKKMGDLGLLGLCKPVEYGGAGLDYSYGMVMAEELGAINAGGVSDPDRALGAAQRRGWPRSTRVWRRR